MKKSELKTLIETIVRATLKEADEMITYKGNDGKSHSIKLSSALSYDKNHPARKAAEAKLKKGKTASSTKGSVFNTPTANKPSTAMAGSKYAKEIQPKLKKALSKDISTAFGNDGLEPTRTNFGEYVWDYINANEPGMSKTDMKSLETSLWNDFGKDFIEKAKKSVDPNIKKSAAAAKAGAKKNINNINKLFSSKYTKVSMTPAGDGIEISPTYAGADENDPNYDTPKHNAELKKIKSQIMKMGAKPSKQKGVYTMADGTTVILNGEL